MYRGVLIILITFFLSNPGIAQKKNNGKKEDHLSQRQIDSLNQFVEIDRIFIVGNKKTKEKIIRRELDIYDGQVLTKKMLGEFVEEDKNKLNNLSLFTFIEFTVIDLLNGKVDIIIRVSERWYFFPVPIFQLADRNFTEWWVNQHRSLKRVEYGLRLRHFNFRGRNEKVDLTAQFGYTKLFSLAYSIPYIDKQQKVGLSFAAAYSTNKDIAVNTVNHRLNFIRKEDNLRTRFLSSAYLNLRPSFYNFHRLGVWYSNVHIHDTVAMINPDYLLNGKTDQQYVALTYRFRRDLRDYRSYALKGFFIQAEINKIGLGFFGDADIVQLNAMFRKYFDLGKNFYFASNFSLSSTFPEKQPYRNYNGVGFDDNFLRGYEINVIEGQHFIINNNSFKKRIFSRTYDLGETMPIREFSKVPINIYLSLFYDHGIIDNYSDYEQNSRLTNTYLFGGGLGLDVVTMYDSVLRFEYAINKDGQKAFRLNIHAAF